MLEFNFAWRFALCSLAVWRVAHLLASESLQWKLFVRLRATLGSYWWGRLMDSFYSLSFLISLPLALWISSSLMGFLIQWLALSAVACLLEKVTHGTHKHSRVRSVSTSYLDKVISG